MVWITISHDLISGHNYVLHNVNELFMTNLRSSCWLHKMSTPMMDLAAQWPNKLLISQAVLTRTGPVLGGTRAGPGGGVCVWTPPPSNSAPDAHRRKRKKRPKARQKAFQNYLVIFSLRSTIRSLEVMEGQNMLFMDIFHEGADYPRKYGS